MIWGMAGRMGEDGCGGIWGEGAGGIKSSAWLLALAATVVLLKNPLAKRIVQ